MSPHPRRALATAIGTNIDKSIAWMASEGAKRDVKIADIATRFTAVARPNRRTETTVG